ncbi:amidase [Gordonia hydrophobica]|nr:amidase [Gordonia hydrophobica]
MDLDGAPSRHGCAGNFHPRQYSSESVRRLESAGAIIIGKTNLPEFGQWPFTEGVFGSTRNPWNLRHTPGGSSGGSASAVSAGIVHGALGSDGAGSVRIPAAWTGLVGIKPHRGRLSTAPDDSPFYGLTCFGPLARTVGDAALLLTAATGGDDLFPTTIRVALQRRDPGRLRVGLSLNPPFSGYTVRLHPDVRRAVERIAYTLDGLGHEVVPIDAPYRLMGVGFLPRSLRGIADLSRTVPDIELLDPRTRANARIGELLPSLATEFATISEGIARRRFSQVFKTVDVLLTPTTATAPPEVGSFDDLSNAETDRQMIAAAPYCWPWNVLGWPAVNIPAGLTPSGLPVGAQLLGASRSEPLLVELAAQLEGLEQWQLRRPPAAQGA